MRWRSMLFAPADNAQRCAKAADAGADAVILDLEDAVAMAAKPAARDALPALVAAVRAGGAKAVVRINGAWLLAVEDLRAAVGAGADAVMVPKAQDPAALMILSQMAAEMGRGDMPMVALIESPEGVARAAQLAAVPGVVALALGTEDFSLAMGVAPEQVVLDLPSRMIAMAAAQAGIMALAVPFSIARFREGAAYEQACVASAAHGVTGAICIHPAQVAIANAAFGLGEEARAQAQGVVAAWDEAQAQGLSVITLNGQMIDLPVALRARRLLGV